MRLLVLALALLASIPAVASEHGLAIGSGPFLRVRLFASEGFCEVLPVNSFDPTTVPRGGFAITTETGVLIPALQRNAFALVWEDFDFHGTVGVTATQATRHISWRDVEYANASGALNAAPFFPEPNPVLVEANAIQGILIGLLTVGAAVSPFSIPLAGGTSSTEMSGLHALDFNRPRSPSSSSNHPVGLPFKTPIAQSV